jgi:hypothetical protein
MNIERRNILHPENLKLFQEARDCKEFFMVSVLVFID